MVKVHAQPFGRREEVAFTGPSSSADTLWSVRRSWAWMQGGCSMNHHGLSCWWVRAIVAAVVALGVGLGLPLGAVAQSGQLVVLAMGRWQGADSFHQVQ